MCSHAVDRDVVEELASARTGAARPRDGGPAGRGCWRLPRRRGYGWELSARVKLRLYHHPDGARIAYREAGTGPPLALLHSQGLTHREFEPVVDELAHRHRVVLPDLPLHGAPRTARATRTRRSG